jgi:hypothetical protein
MSIEIFENLNLTTGDTIYIIRKDGKRMQGEYLNSFDANACSFLFRNFSTSAPETIRIRSISSIDKKKEFEEYV